MLEKAAYVQIDKGFVGKKPRTRMALTAGSAIYVMATRHVRKFKSVGEEQDEVTVDQVL